MNDRNITTPPALPADAVPETVKQAVVAYSSRDWARAEQLCRAALQALPDFFDALNLLGAITAQTQRQTEAADLMRRAVAAQPGHAAAHCNYGNVLRELRQFDAAVASYDRAIALKPDFAEAYSNRGNALQELGQLDAAVASYDQALALKPEYALAHFNRGNALNALNRADAALASYDRAIALRPGYAEAYGNRGVALKELKQLDAAIASYQQAIALKPDYAEAHNNLGNALQELKQLDAAIASYDRAIAARPDYAMAYYSRGVAQQELRQMDAAAISYKRAAALAPDDVEAHNNLGFALKSLGRFADAESSYRKALALNPDLRTAKTGFAEAVSAIEFYSSNPIVCATMAQALAEAWIRPSNLSRAAGDLIVLGLRNKKLMPPAHSAHATTESALPDAAALKALDDDALLLALLCGTPVVNATLEDFLTRARRSALAQAADAVAANAGAHFYCALAQQCFINEYVFSHTRDEIEAAGKLKEALIAALDKNTAPPLLWIVAVACYFPLHALAGAEKLLAYPWPDAVKNLLTLQIQEPREELRLRPTIPQLTRFEDDVSLAVQHQYEENPYPRWIKNPQSRPQQDLVAYLRATFPFAEIQMPEITASPEILIAGCGTGQHPIDTAQFVQGAKILAIDLSLSSLSYAKRKTQELGIQSIDFAQADILKLDTLGRSFDVIESSGVLHHLAKPLDGWRLLLSLLRPKGFMKLGFYSELARRDIVKVRNLISARGFASTPEAIRACRQYLRQVEKSENIGSVLRGDFFSTSNCRDLLFHVQEHRMTLDIIDAFLQENHLTFLGFQFDSPVLNAYRLRFPDDRAGTNLDHWKIYEREYPDTFFGMYQFWVQKH